MKRDDVEHALRNIGERIARAGQEAGFTRREIGEIAGVDESVVRTWEETRSRPSLWQVKELARHCKTTPDWLLGRDLIEALMVDQARHGYVCPGGTPQEGLPLVDLDAIREFILGVWLHPRPEMNSDGVPVVPAEPHPVREVGDGTAPAPRSPAK